MPKKSKYNYYAFDVTKVPEMASFIIYGLLKNQLTTEQKDEIFKKISVYNVMCAQTGSSDFDKVYGREIGNVVQNNLIDDETIELETPKFSNTSEKSFYVQFTDAMNPALKIFKSGVKDLAKVMKEKRDAIQFRSLAEKNYYDLMQLMIEDAANEKTWRDNIQADVAYEYAWNSQIKINLTAARPEIDFKSDPENPKFVAFVTEMNDSKVLRLIDETGIPAAVSGALRTVRKLEDHIKNGDVGREELIREYEAQQARMEKALSLDEETYNKLKKAGALQNKLEEYTDGDRGYKYVLDDVIAKKNLLKAGWPASDIQDLANFRRLLGMVESKYVMESGNINEELEVLQRDIDSAAQMPEGTEEEKKKKSTRQNELNDRKTKLENKKPQIESAKGYVDEMKELWKATIAGKGLTAAERTNRLNNINEFLNKSKDNFVFAGAEYVKGRVGGMISKELNPSDKALLSQDVADYVRNLESVDPALVGSSKQFGSFKTALKELNRLKRNLDVNNPEKVNEYKEKVKEAAEKATVYLRYKTYQYNDKRKGDYKRSELEVKRVGTVDAILNGLKKLTVPNSNELIIPEKNDYHVIVPTKIPGFLGEYADTPKTDAFDKVIERYTGRGIINGTLPKMRKSFVKALACYVMKNKKNAVYNKEDIVKEYEKLNKEFDFDDMTAEELRDALQNPAMLGKTLSEKIVNTYAPDGVADYEKLVGNMKALYTRIGTKNHIVKDEDFKIVLGHIEQLAHLPETLEGMDKEMVFQYVGWVNHEIFRTVRDRMLRDPKHIDQTDKYGIIIIKAIGGNCTGVMNLTKNLESELIEKRAPKKDRQGRYLIADPRYFNFDNYGSNAFEHLINKDQRRQLKPDLLEKQSQQFAMSPKRIREEMSADKAEVIKGDNAKSKDAPVKGNKNNKTKSRPRSNSMG